MEVSADHNINCQCRCFSAQFFPPHSSLPKIMSPCAVSSKSLSSEEDGNPLMALVDAAASVQNENPSDKATNESIGEKKFSFAEELMALIDDEANCDVISWMPDGKAFTIIDPKRFTKVEMPKIFNIRNMSSFVRKLTRWGFHRFHEKETQNSDIFKHENFRRGEHKLCSQIKCLARKPTSSIAKPMANTKPLLIANKGKQPSTMRESILPRSAPSSITNGTSPHGDKALVYLDEACRLAHSRNLLKSYLLLQPSSTASDPVSSLLSAAMESLRRDQASSLLNTHTESKQTVNSLALHRLIEAEKQKLVHLGSIPSWLTSASGRSSLAGFRAMY